MRGRLFLWARYIGLVGLLLPALVWCKSWADTKLIGMNAGDTFLKVQRLSGSALNNQCFIWYMTGCKPCVEEFPLIAKLDSIGKATGSFSVTMIGLGTDSSLAQDKQWNRIKCHKMACESTQGLAYYASPSYHTLGKLSPPKVYPAYVLLKNGKMIRYRYGAAEKLDDLLP